MKRSRSEHITAQCDALRCPLCGAELSAAGASLHCHNKHCFDVSAKGYVNFVPAQRDTLYDADLFESRARVYAQGAYAALAQAVADALPPPDGTRPLSVLDAGCGDGYIAKALENCCRVFALDLSKQAIALAARGGTEACLMVGDLTRLPLRDGAMDAVVNVLSPAHYPEFRRVLRAGGRVIKAVPQEDYLIELRQAAGTKIRHADYSNVQTVGLFHSQFPLCEERTVRTVFPIPSEGVRRDVLHMTPLLANVNKEDAVFSCIDRVTVSLKLLIGTKD